MRHACILALLFAGPLAAQEPPAAPAEENVNERYTVESFDLRGPSWRRVSAGLRADFEQMVRKKFNQKTLDALIDQIGRAHV